MHAGDGGGRGGLSRLGGDASARSAPRRSSAPPICSKTIAASCWRFCKMRAARRSTTRSPNCARRSIIAAITRRRRACASAPQPLPGPTGESNVLRYRGRGVFVCISPWNFPLAIFLGQVAPRSPPAMRSWRSRRSRRRSIAARAVALLHRSRRAGDRAPSRARRRRDRRRSRRRRRAPPASASPARPKSAARSTARSPPNAARSCR